MEDEEKSRMKDRVNVLKGKLGIRERGEWEKGENR